MADDLALRLATIGDIDTLAAFQQNMAWETEGKTLTEDTVRRGIAGVFERPERGFYLVAESQGAVVGGLLVTYEWSDWRNANFWWVQSVYVDADWRRRGVYRAMYDHVRQLAAARSDVYRLRLCVDQDNHVAQAVYQTLGMSPTRYYMYEAGLEPLPPSRE